MLQVLFQRTVINAYLFGDNVYETGEDCRVNQVHEERADHRYNQEGFVRRTESLCDGLHIGNGGRSAPKPKPQCPAAKTVAS